MNIFDIGKSVYTGNGNSGAEFIFLPGKKTRSQRVEDNFVTMDSLGGPIEYVKYIEGSEVAEDQHTGSEVNLKRAIGWLNACQQSHELCTCTINPLTELPTRVIDLGPSNSTQAPFLYNSKKEYAHYCTLSHRWAGKSVVRTLNGNIKLHEKELPLPELSATFRDAIKTCRKLCIRYLWIDSLCIIQDGREDWEHESARMGDYYWNSFVTIAADHASEENQGCFRRRDPCSIQPCLVTLTFPQDIDRSMATVRVAPRIQEGADWRHKKYSILDTRSWVLQERVLSPRTLFFGAHQMCFQCISMQASESIPEGRDRTTVRVQAPFEEFQRQIRSFVVSEDTPPATAKISEKTGVKTDLPSGESLISVEPGVDKEVDQKTFIELHENWYELLKEYSKRSITQKSDVLPALSGLAQRFHKILGETYLAGHWSGDLKFGLLWSVDESSQRAGEYIAPSWSWASIRTCQLSFNFDYERVANGNLCRIHKAELTTRGSDSYGQVTKGRLYIKGMLKMATAVYPSKEIQNGNNKHVPDMDVRYEGTSDLMFREMINAKELEEGECAYLGDSDSGDRFCKFESDGKFDFTDALVFCLPIATQRIMLDGREAALCLVLQPIHFPSLIWRRVGFARIPKVDWFVDAHAFPLIIE